MKIDFEYGQGTMPAQLPDSTDIFIPGETVKDPDFIPEDQLENAYQESLAHPIGMPTLGASLSTQSGLLFFAGTQDFYKKN